LSWSVRKKGYLVKEKRFRVLEKREGINLEKKGAKVIRKYEGKQTASSDYGSGGVGEPTISGGFGGRDEEIEMPSHERSVKGREHEGYA